MTVTPSAAIVGAKITIVGRGYPPGSTLALGWGTANASWVVSGNPPQVGGVKVVQTERMLGSVETNASGIFRVTTTVPSDYGGQHVIQAAFANGSAIAGRGLFNLEPSFRIASSSGVAGSPIEVSASGLGYGEYSTSYHLYWDNSYVGYFTGISTHGEANFTFYASGTPGTHYIEIYQGYPGPGYLNPQQGPPSSETQSVFPPFIPFHAEFNVTSGQTTTGGPLLSGSMGIASVVVLGAALTASGLLVVIVRNDQERRRKIFVRATAALVAAAVVVAGAAVYLAFAPTPAVQSASFTPQTAVVRPTIQVPQSTPGSGPRITVTPNAAYVGQTVTVAGTGFAPSSQVPLSWSTRKGSNLLGYKLIYEPLRNVSTNSGGSFSFSMKTPADLGGLHFITSGNLTTHSNGTLLLERTASINATEGPAGTVVAVTMTGVGWTFNTNIAAIDYDNSYLGYGCGFNSGGNVTFYLTVSGAPGVHTIDLYPSIWWGTSNYYNQSVVEYRYPLLDPQDHPQSMPSFHFTFLVTAAGAGTQDAGYIPLSAWVVPIPLALAALVPLRSGATDIRPSDGAGKQS
jgi:hypothetical protein